MYLYVGELDIPLSQHHSIYMEQIVTGTQADGHVQAQQQGACKRMQFENQIIKRTKNDNGNGKININLFRNDDSPHSNRTDAVLLF